MIGALLGKYRILSLLGEGGMGVVYVGRHEALGHSVVVKVLQPELSRDTEMVQRFFNEAQAATAIRNLGIVQVFDFGTTPDGRAYFVMELLEGQNLAARLKERRPGYVECCRIGRQIANVLQAAHARGITHRDLKPDNLFLVPDAEAMSGERVKVLDFGIAKLADRDHASAVRTRTGLIMGTPYYMSPEQCRGAGVIDARSDIYSLGCILFEMTCGRPPFIAEGSGEILGAHQFLDSPHPQSLAPDMPPALAALIANMLAKQPDARPQTMAIVSQNLDEILQTLGAPARASTPLPVPMPTPSPTPTPSPASALRPLPAPPVLPPSTTLGGSAGMPTGRARGKSRRFSFVLGGFGVAVVVGAMMIVLATTAPGSSEQQVSNAAVATLQSADTGSPDAQVTVTPLPTPDAEEVPVTPPDSAIKVANPMVAKELKSRALLETKARSRIADFESAMRDRDLKKAGAVLDGIPTTATNYAKVWQKYNQAVNVAIQDLVFRLARVSHGDCNEYNQLVQQEKESKPPRVAAEASRLVKCTPAAQVCNADALAKEARSHYNANQLASSLVAFEAAYECMPDPRRALSVFIIACELPNISKAKLFWKRMTVAMRQEALGIDICNRNRITADELNAP